MNAIASPVMKATFPTLGLVLLALPVCGGIITRTQTFNENTLLHDGTGLGNEFSRSANLFADMPGALITSLSLELEIEGGYNGQIYAYLSKESGFAVLLNRPGRTTTGPNGFLDPGLSVVLADDAPDGDIHDYTPHDTGLPLTGTWAPDGREIDPLLVLQSDPRTALLNTFIGVTADGVWTLYVEDVVTGQQAALNRWSLIVGVNVTTVPEPSTLATNALVLLGLGGYALRRYRRKSPPV